ncbi:MAG: Crp/Fnr family transcriptional regulator [Bacilli bacterium]|nr:Crp/Fnr family transcriptional regulator [Bacilli bacterium]
MLEKLRIYENLDEKKFLSTLQSNTILYKNNQTIAYSLGNRNIIGIIEEGSANLVRFDYNGERTIVEELYSGDIFSDMFYSSTNSELLVIATSDSQVTFVSYDELVNKAQTSINALTFLNNLINQITEKLVRRNERIELLTTRTIRNKLLAYFELQTKKVNSKSFDLEYTYTDLADYLAIDRSAMMRELKHLKEDGFINDINRKITLLY